MKKLKIFWQRDKARAFPQQTILREALSPPIHICKTPLDNMSRDNHPFNYLGMVNPHGMTTAFSYMFLPFPLLL